MSLEKVENLLHACVALSFAAGLLVVVAPPAKADAAGDWLAYRLANGLPVDPKPSLPGELPVGDGPVPDSLLEPLPNAFPGNGNGNGGKFCEDALAVEMAKSDGDVRGEDALCK